MFKTLITAASLSILLAAPVNAAQYAIDAGHSFVEFRIKHLGYSWLYGRFNRIKGVISYDSANSADSLIKVEIETASVDTNHAERDKHLRSADFLDVQNHPSATFTSTAIKLTEQGGSVEGDLTLHGITKPVVIEVVKIGEGKDPWGGYRVGFQGTMQLSRSDFNISYNLGPASESMELQLGIEAIRE